MRWSDDFELHEVVHTTNTRYVDVLVSGLFIKRSAGCGYLYVVWKTNHTQLRVDRKKTFQFVIFTIFYEYH